MYKFTPQQGGFLFLPDSALVLLTPHHSHILACRSCMSLSNNNNNRIWSERNNLAQYYSFLPFTAFSLHHRLLLWDVLALCCFAQSSSRNGGICLLEPTNHNLLPHLIAFAEFRRLGNPMQSADRQLLCSATRNAGKGSRNQDKDGIIIIGPNQWEICYFLKVLILPSCWLLHSYFATLGPYLFIEISDHSSVGSLVFLGPGRLLLTKRSL